MLPARSSAVLALLLQAAPPVLPSSPTFQAQLLGAHKLYEGAQFAESVEVFAKVLPSGTAVSCCAW